MDETNIFQILEEILPCIHYTHNCMFYMKCCNTTINCKRCHDEINDNEIDIKKHHKFNKSNVILTCKICDATQQQISNNCEQCNAKFGKYFCEECMIFDDVNKQQFHCSGCGICRVGGQRNYTHCNTCNCCVSVTGHTCINNMINDSCAICCEDLFNSQHQIYVTKCNHVFHQHCFLTYATTNYKCPLCSKSSFDMMPYFNALNEQILASPMPEEYADTMVNILCNDCLKKSNVKLHFIGLKCSHCSSFNTTQ